jgi:hypothetical protein
MGKLIAVPGFDGRHRAFAAGVQRACDIPWEFVRILQPA